MLFRTLFFLLLAVSLSAHAEIPDPCAAFGTKISVFPYTDKDGKEIDLSGDFNGDGIRDKLFILSISQDSKISSEVVVYNPVGNLKQKVILEKQLQKVVLSAEPTLAIGIVEGAAKGKTCKKIILYNENFFGHPAPSTSSLKLYEYFFLEVFRTGGPRFNSWKDFLKNKDMKNDFFHVAGNLGYLAVYWDEGKYRSFLYDPHEGESDAP